MKSSCPSPAELLIHLVRVLEMLPTRQTKGYLHVLHAEKQLFLFSIIAHTLFCPWNGEDVATGDCAFWRFETLETDREVAVNKLPDASLLRRGKLPRANPGDAANIHQTSFPTLCRAR